MNFQEFFDSITPDVYEKLKRGVELGRWPDGSKLTSEQRETCLQALIAYEARHVPEQQRSGYIPRDSHSHCGGRGEVAGPGDTDAPADVEQALNWQR